MIKLTEREKEVMRYIAMGYSSKEVADKLNRSKRTVDFHLENIYHKLEVHNRIHALNKIKKLGISLKAESYSLCPICKYRERLSEHETCGVCR